MIRNILYILLCISCITVLVMLRNVIAYRDIEKIKIKAPEYIEKMNMIIVNYDGYEGDIIHGGFAWYKTTDENNYLYEFRLGDWDGELMLYDMTCLNAVKNDN